MNTYNWDHQQILIVEDDISSFSLLQAILRKTNITIHHASDGEQAVNICRTNPSIDLVLMDIQLPKMDGYTATQNIKQLRKNLPVIAQTAHVMEEDRMKSIKSGCDDYSPKPINRDELLRMISKYLK